MSNETMTYAEAMGKDRFYWNAFLENAEAGYTSIEDDLRADELASNWVTCACGNQCDAIDRDPTTGSPDDPYLRALGSQFSKDVDSKDWKSAKETLALIERRSTEILLSKPQFPKPDRHVND